MPVVTQHRDLPELHFTPEYWSIVHYGGDTGDIRYPWVAERDIIPTGDQTTTSFRTFRGKDELADPELLQQTSGSQFGLIRELGQRAKEDVGRSGNTDRFGKPYDTGHEFSTEKRSISYGATRHHAVRRNVSYAQDLHYVGPIYPVLFGNPWPTLPTLSESLINSNGARLIRNTIPTSPVAGLAQFFGELREGIPSLPAMTALRNKTLSRGLGSEYLNTQFGIRPFISDIQKLALSVQTGAKLLRQLKRDSGLQVRRKSSLNREVEFTDVDTTGISWYMYMPRRNLQGNQAQLFYDNSSPYVELKCTEYKTTRAWFSGAYQYFLHDAGNLIGRLERYEQQANLLLGSEITPETIWQLTPWSWLVDWFGDVDTFLWNAVRLSSDNLVLRYGYVMHETHASREYRVTGLTPRDGEFPRSVYVTYEITRKQRHRATPYGFGVDLSALNATRSAILGALGLTRAPGVLRRPS
jgi:hypothetical protein